MTDEVESSPRLVERMVGLDVIMAGAVWGDLVGFVSRFVQDLPMPFLSFFFLGFQVVYHPPSQKQRASWRYPWLEVVGEPSIV